MTHWHRKPEGRLKDFGLFHAKGVASIAQALADDKLKRWGINPKRLADVLYR